MLRMINDSYRRTIILKLLMPPICPFPPIATQSLEGERVRVRGEK